MKKSLIIFATLFTILLGIAREGYAAGWNAKVFTRNHQGEQVLVWIEHTFYTGGNSITLYVSYRTATQHWTTPVALSSWDNATTLDVAPQVSTDNNRSTFVAVWKQEISPGKQMIFSSIKQLNRSWSSPQILSEDDEQHGNCFSFSLEKNDDLMCLLSWEQQVQDGKGNWRESIWTTTFGNTWWETPEQVPLVGEE